jgi:hypothetical protein
MIRSIVHSLRLREGCLDRWIIYYCSYVVLGDYYFGKAGKINLLVLYLI